MPDIAARIAQFKNMAEADPDNELGHFSLGRAYFDAGMYPEASDSFERVIQINPAHSKAYQSLAEALLKQKRKDEAIARLTEGVKIADERGNLMPRNAMTQMLKDLGAPVPELIDRSANQPVGEGQVLDARTGRPGSRMAKPPFRNKMGQFLFEHVSVESWKEWIGMGTKVINELRLPLNDPQAQKLFDQHMLEFLNLKELWEQEKTDTP